MQDVVVEFVDQLATSKTIKALDQDGTRDRVGRIVKAMREIQVEMA